MTTRTLSTAEMARIRAELFDNVLAGGARPYVSVGTLYDVIASNVESSAIDPTTSATAVTEAGAASLTLASVTGLAASSRVVIDVDDAREVCTVRAVSGSAVSVICKRLHAGTYPVEIESPLTIVRGLLADLERVDQRLRDAVDDLGVKKVDEVEFFSASEGSVVQVSERLRQSLRARLAAACGLTAILAEARAAAMAAAGAGGGDMEAY